MVARLNQQRGVLKPQMRGVYPGGVSLELRKRRAW